MQSSGVGWSRTHIAPGVLGAYLYVFGIHGRLAHIERCHIMDRSICIAVHYDALAATRLSNSRS
jgi:hypothetical protein